MTVPTFTFSAVISPMTFRLTLISVDIECIIQLNDKFVYYTDTKASNSLYSVELVVSEQQSFQITFKNVIGEHRISHVVRWVVPNTYARDRKRVSTMGHMCGSVGNHKDFHKYLVALGDS